MATAATIKRNIAKLEAALKSKATPKSLKSKLETQLVKSKAELSGINKGSKPKTSTSKSAQTALQKLKEMVNKNKKLKTYKKSGVDLEKDADRPALPIGRRTAKQSGKTYYEYRANRIDVKQPPKRYPKLEKGGYMAKGGKVSEQEAKEKLAKLMSDGKLHFSIGNHGLIFMSLKNGNKKSYDNYKKAYEHYLNSKGVMMAKGGSVKARLLEQEKVRHSKPHIVVDNEKMVVLKEFKNYNSAQKFVDDYLDANEDKYGTLSIMPKESSYANAYMAKGGKIDYSKQTSDDFKLGEIVWDTDNKRYGTIIGIYDKYASDKYEVRLDTDGMQPTENLRKIGSPCDNGTKEQLDEEIDGYARLVKEYPKNNYPKQIKPMLEKGGYYAKGGYMAKGGENEDLSKVDSVLWKNIENNRYNVSALVIKYDEDSELRLLVIENGILLSNWINTKYFEKQPFSEGMYPRKKFNKQKIREEVINLLKENNLDSIKKEGLSSSSLKYLKKYAKGGMSQGYDDREDERLGMKYGKIGSKDLDSTHARRDDARFEERMADGGKTKVDRERMYNFLKDDLASLEKAIEANNQEEINDIFLYWNRHIKDLEPETGSKRMYEFLKDDLVALEAATKELPSSKEETDRFFSYWNIHLSSLEPKMEKGGYMAKGGYYAKGGAMEHGLKRGDTIIDDMSWDNSVKVLNNKTGYAVVHLETGERKEMKAMGGEMHRTQE